MEWELADPFVKSRRRDRRDRGARGPALLPGPHAPGGVPAHVTGRERFDALALAIAGDVCERWKSHLGTVEVAVEEIPVLPRNWVDSTVPLSAYVGARPPRPARLVLFRRPLEHRARAASLGNSWASSAGNSGGGHGGIERVELEVLLLTVVVEQVCEVLGLPPEEIHPGYDAG